MTRKDYVKLAQALHVAKGPESSNQWVTDVAAVAIVLANDNPRFSSAKFYDACLNGIDKAESDNA